MFFMGLIRDILTRQELSRTGEVEFLRSRIMALEDCILEMKKEGFQRPPVTQQFQRDLLSHEIMSAIDTSANEGTTLFTDLLEHAKARQIAGVPDDVIADEIIKGSSFEDFD